MNYTLSVIYRLIPLIAALFCFIFGFYVIQEGSSDAALAGRVVFFLGAICICLFCTACTIIRQLIGYFNLFDKLFYPIIAILAAIITAIYSFYLMSYDSTSWQFIAAHVIFGLALICGCISTVVLGSREFSRIPRVPEPQEPLPYNLVSIWLFYIAPVVFAFIAWIFAFVCTSIDTENFFIAGHVMLGLAAICTCLIALVDSIVRQECNFYNEFERWFYPILVIVMALICFIYGIYLISDAEASYYLAPGYVLLGLGAICISILGKVLLLALVWRRKFNYAYLLPLLPVLTALFCFILGGILMYYSDTTPDYVIPGHVLLGLGAICASLFSIVSILESGTSGE